MTCEFMMISVLMCVHNAERTLRSALDSVTSQTYKEIEIVVVNDGSSDGSLGVLEEFSENFSSIRIITQKNQGIGVARNRCLAEASHPWVTFIDADDLWHPQKLELQVNAVLAAPDMDCVLTGNQEFVREDEIRVNNSKKIVSGPPILLAGIFKQLAEINFNFPPATALWRKEKLVRFGGYSIDKNGEDYYPFLVSALHDDKFYRIDETLYFVRKTTNSLSRSKLNHFTGAVARVNAIERLLFLEVDKHSAYLSPARRESLERGRQKFIRWVLFGIRTGLSRNQMIPAAIPYLKRMTSIKAMLVESGKIFYCFVLNR